MPIDLLYNDLLAFVIISDTLSDDEISTCLLFMQGTCQFSNSARVNLLKTLHPDLFSKLKHLFLRLYPSEDVSYEE